MYKIQGDYSKDDFFKSNPELSLLSEINGLRDRENASQVMWSIYLVEHPDSRFYRIGDRQKKREEIEKNFLKCKLDWENLDKVILEFISVTTSDTKRSYKIWKEKAQDLDNYVKSLTFEENSDILLKLFKEVAAIWRTLAEIESKMVDEESKDQIKGKGNLSAREKRYG